MIEKLEYKANYDVCISTLAQLDELFQKYSALVKFFEKKSPNHHRDSKIIFFAKKASTKVLDIVKDIQDRISFYEIYNIHEKFEYQNLKIKNQKAEIKDQRVEINVLKE